MQNISREFFSKTSEAKANIETLTIDKIESKYKGHLSGNGYNDVPIKSILSYPYKSASTGQAIHYIFMCRAKATKFTTVFVALIFEEKKK